MVIHRSWGAECSVFFTCSYFYSLVYIGTPPQRQTVILDTGSSILAFPCTGFVCLILLMPSCNNCGSHQNSPFNPLLSNTITISPFSSLCHPSLHPVRCDETMYKGKCSICENRQCQFYQVSLLSSFDSVLFGRKQSWRSSLLGHAVAGRQHRGRIARPGGNRPIFQSLWRATAVRLRSQLQRSLQIAVG